MSRSSRPALELFVSGVTGLGFLAGIYPIANLLFGPIGLMFGFAAVVGAFLLVLTNLSGTAFAKAIITLGVFGVLAFGLTFGTMWYFISYLPSQGPSAFMFKLPEVTPKPTITGTPSPMATRAPAASRPAPTQPPPTGVPAAPMLKNGSG